MKTITVKTLDGNHRILDAETVKDFADRLDGPLLQPGDDSYDDSRALWNGMIDRHPALIVGAVGTDDIKRTVDFARTHELLLAVRGGGHNVAGSACCDGGLMLDLSALKDIRINPEAGTVRVEPGANWGEVDRKTQPFGLAVPNGIISTTGVAGLTLGGGFGWLSRKYGYTCDSLLEAEVVAADGSLHRASVEENPDLFWALRGGGGNFGVVTSFTYRLCPLGPEVAAGMIVYPLDQAPAVLDFFREFTAAAPEELTSLLVLTPAPPAPFLPAEWHGRQVVAVAVCYAGAVAEGMELLQKLKSFGQPLGDAITPKSFLAHQSMLDAGQPHGRRYYWKSHYLTELSPEACEVLLKQGDQMAGHSKILLMHLGGAITRQENGDTAAGHRDARYVLNIAAAWENPADDLNQTTWARQSWKTMEYYASGGVYMNFLSEDEQRADRVQNAYDAEQYSRLTALKARYDPTNLFRLNPNVRPVNEGLQYTVHG